MRLQALYVSIKNNIYILYEMPNTIVVRQVAALRWKQLLEKARETEINFKVLYDALRNLESTWERDILSKGEVSVTYLSNN